MVFLIRVVSHDVKDDWKVVFQYVLGLFCVVNIKNFVQISIYQNQNFQNRYKSQDEEVFCDYELKILPSKIRITNKCHKLFERTKSSLKLSCYCHVSRDTLYL